MLLPIYTKIYLNLTGCNGLVSAIASHKDGYYRIVKMNGEGFVSLESIRPYSQKFGIGAYYMQKDNAPALFDEKEVLNAVKTSELYELKKEEEKKEKEKAYIQEKEGLLTKYPTLIANPTNEEKITKQNLLIMLKQNFETQKFSIRKDGYKAYIIRWENGVSLDAVQKVVELFEGWQTDFTGDYYDPIQTAFTEVFGSFKFISAYREVSQKYKDGFFTILRKVYDESVQDGYIQSNVVRPGLAQVEIYDKNIVGITRAENGKFIPVFES